MGERMKMKQEKAEALKQTILNVAYELFLTHGYEKVCLADIEQGAGATRGSLIYHYRSKETLLLLTSEKFIADFFRDTCPDEEVINSRTPLKDYLKAFVQIVEAQVRHFKENIVKDTKVTSASSINFMIHLCTLSASFKRALQAFHTTQMGYWSEVINRAKACGEIRQALSTVTLVDTFVHILSGIIFQSAVCHYAGDNVHDVGRRLHTAPEPICPLRKRLGACSFSSLPLPADGRRRPPSEVSARAAERKKLQP